MQILALYPKSHKLGNYCFSFNRHLSLNITFYMLQLRPEVI